MENNITNDVLLYRSLIEFYNKDKNIEKLNEILFSTKISLRIIDWFVTNYSKKNNTNYPLYIMPSGKITINDVSTNEIHKQITIHHSYKSQLKSYQKKNFDPFCRRNRINFECKNFNISTTIGQLNFFKWAIENLVLEYIKNNYDEIEEDMNISIKKPKNKSNQNKTRKKRQELSKSASRGLNKNNVTVKISFD
tara:strand:- start:3594 stop:4175 length:582 start_codon:yes stop_codon:yes gene_type:complete